MKYLLLALLASSFVACSSTDDNDADPDAGTRDETGGGSTDVVGGDTQLPPPGSSVDALVQAICEIDAPCALQDSCDVPTATAAELTAQCVSEFGFTDTVLTSCATEVRTALQCLLDTALPACAIVDTEGFCEDTQTEDGIRYSRFPADVEETCTPQLDALFACEAGLGYLCDDDTYIPWAQVCDGTTQCGDGDDEDEFRCEDPFRCTNGRVIPSEWICDGDNDCGDMSDEQNCE